MNLKPFSILDSDSMGNSEKTKILNRSVTSTLYTQAGRIPKKLTRPTIFDVNGELARAKASAKRKLSPFQINKVHTRPLIGLFD